MEGEAGRVAMARQPVLSTRGLGGSGGQIIGCIPLNRSDPGAPLDGGRVGGYVGQLGCSTIAKPSAIRKPFFRPRGRAPRGGESIPSRPAPPRELTAMAHQVTLIPGDGVGPELAEVTRACIDATGVKIDWDVQEAGVDVMAKVGTPVPDAVLESCKRTGVALKAPITTPVGTGFRSVNVYLRQALDLYACVRPCKQFPGVRSYFEKTKIDIVLVRENTEDLYLGCEFEQGKPETAELIADIKKLNNKTIRPDSGISIKPISITGSRRIVKYAFDYARKHGRKKVTAVHKANILKYSDGLFLEVAREVAKEYADIEFEDRIVDNMCMQLVQKPELYDVLVLPNLYGDILSDLGAGLVGGLGVAPARTSATRGPSSRRPTARPRSTRGSGR